MRLQATILVAVLSAAALACASVYDYHYRASSPEGPDIQAIATRLAGALEPQGFKELTVADDDLIPHVGDTGFLDCPDSSDLVLFLRERSGRTSVHLYACQGEARIVALADSWVPGEPASTSGVLSREFASELTRGEVTLVHRHRIALE
jgi:hypothetical protein